MGMFNYVYCDYPLPGPHKDVCFQTKSLFDNCMDTYYISEDGQLYKRDFYDDVDADLGLHEPHIDWLRRNVDKLSVIKVSGEICFYTITNDHGGWLEYSAVFDLGKITGVSIVIDREKWDWK